MSLTDLARLFVPAKGAERSRQLRRAFPIHMYVGRNGSAKSLAMVYDTIPDLESGLEVLSTVRLLDYRNPRPCEGCFMHERLDDGHLAAHPQWVPFTDWPQLLDFKAGAILMDEVTGVASSRESSGMPAVVANKLHQLRRDKVVVRLTGLSFIRADKVIREAINAVTRCQSFMPVTVVEGDAADRMWRPRRLAVWRTYDAQSLPTDDHTDAAYEKADLLVKGRAWIPGLPAIDVYDTRAPVLMVGSVTDSGRCAYCNGTRRALECSCADYQDRKPARGRKGGPQPRSGEDRTGVLELAQPGRSGGRRATS